jgi:hypothetical protein
MHLSELLMMIAGEVFKHLFYHFTLTLSKWEWGMVLRSELCESLAECL